jgi:hypothetical protein
MFFVCIMWGFDSLAGGIVVAIDEFRKDFGVPFAGDYVIDASWQLGWQAATLFGLVFGGFIAGITIDRFGRRSVLLFGYCMTIGGVLAQFFGGKLLTGMESAPVRTLLRYPTNKLAQGYLHDCRSLVRLRNGPPRHPWLHLRRHEHCHCPRLAHWLQCHAPGQLLQRRPPGQGPVCDGSGALSPLPLYSYPSFSSRPAGSSPTAVPTRPARTWRSCTTPATTLTATWPRSARTSPPSSNTRPRRAACSSASRATIGAARSRPPACSLSRTPAAPPGSLATWLVGF